MICAHGRTRDRRQGGRGAGARAGRPDVEAFTERTGRRPGLATVLVGDDPASAVYVGGKQKASARGRHRGLRPPPARRRARARRSPSSIERLNADDEVSGILVPAPGARPPRRRRAHRPDRPGQGRRRPDARERRAARARAPGAAAVHAAGRDGAARRGRRRARGRRGRRRRALQPVRQADGPAAARGQRDGHHLPLAHARPGRGAAGAPTCSSPRSAAPDWSAATGSSPARS